MGNYGVLMVPLAVLVIFVVVFALIGTKRPRAIALKGATAFVMGALPASGITAIVLGENLASYWYAVPLASLLGGLILTWPVVSKPAA
ncbi:MAG: hypothetical protein V4723_06595 [Pseudomonadota bacterium]